MKIENKFYSILFCNICSQFGFGNIFICLGGGGVVNSACPHAFT